MNRSLTLLVILLLGLTLCDFGKRKNLVDGAKIQTYYYSYYYYYDYSWIYYVCSAIVFCVVIFIILRAFCFRNRRIITTNSVPLVQSTYVSAQQPIMSNQYVAQPYSNQQYVQAQPYNSNVNVPNQQINQYAPTCSICHQPLGAQSLDPVNSAPMVLQCTHTFHYGCISNHMKTKNQCPVCFAVIQQPNPQQDYTLQGDVPIANQYQG